jgi:23S rRNA pseudouridine955/2504/2580 synthase
MELKTGENDAGRRLDRVLRKALPDYPLSLLHRLLRQGQVLLDGKRAGPRDRVKSGSVLALFSLPGLPKPAAIPPSSAPSPLAIIAQGGGLIVLNKPAGLSAHGPESLDMLVNAHLVDRLPPSLSFRPGPLHRLDRFASGLIVFSTNLEGARTFSAMMRERKIQKTYLALVEGCIKHGELWQDDLVRDTTARKTFPSQKTGTKKIFAAKPALSRVEPLAVNAAYTLLQVEIETGRTHQIRAQAAARRHPLANDIKYGGHTLKGVPRGTFFLHAWKMALGETMGELPCAFTAPVPELFQNQIRRIFGGMPPQFPINDNHPICR